MRITCPICGERDRREFYYQGAAEALNRPSPDAGDAAWDAYLHIRDNPCGETQDLWQHECCGAWIVVTRDTLTHAVQKVELVRKAKL